MQKKSKLYKRVRADVRSAYAPVFEGLGKQKDVAKEQAERDKARVAAIYGNLASTFDPLNAQFGQTAQALQSGAARALGGVAGSGQEAGIAGVLGAMGQNYGAMLSTGLQGTLGNIAGLEAGALRNRADIETNVMNRYRDFVNELSLTRSDAKAQRAQTFLEQLGAAKDHRLALKEQKLRAEQFDKTFKHGVNQDRHDNKQEDKAAEWVLSQAQREALDKKRVQWRRAAGIPELSTEIASLKTQLESGTLDPIQRTTLQEQLAPLQAELKRKRNRIKKKTRKYKRKVGA